MTEQTKYPKGHYRTCLADKISEYTQQGWTIVEAFDQDLTEHEINQTNVYGHAQELRQRDDAGYGRTCASSTTTPLVTLSRRVFLLQKGTEVVDAELQAANERLSKGYREAWEEKRKGDELLAALRKEHEAKEAELARSREGERAAEARFGEYRARMLRSEGDMGKVRKAIGDREWSRILEGK